MPDQLKQAIHIELQSSYLLLGLLLLIAILSIVSVQKLPVPAWGTCSLQLLILLSTAYYILRDALLHLPWSWQRLTVNVQGELSLINKKGQVFKPQLAHNSFIHPKLILLNFTKQPGRLFKSSLPVFILFADSIHLQQHRQFRLWLKWWQFEEKNNATMPDYHEQ